MKLSIEELTQIYRNGNRALKDVNLVIEDGMFGLLGPNGAGKSTLMKLLVTLMKPSRGGITINGQDLQKNRRQVRSVLGYLPQDFRFFAKLSTWEFLDYSARLAGIKDNKKRNTEVETMLEEVGLFDVRDRKANKLSGGMKRRLGIAQALIGDPKIVIVDEPTTGLDPDERIRFRNLLSKMTEQEMIIILSTHIVGDISSTCNNMALLNEGKVVFNGPPDNLVQKAKGHVFQVEVANSEFEMVNEKYNVISTIPSVNGWDMHIVADELTEMPSQLVEPNLEHAYVYYMEHVLKNQA
ncbi:MAG: ABC transporter ATP-binding protein [Bacteroidetes bacterium]|nr:ABC transporter ATP-binding protein [Bacteroidota bacterium]MBT4400271.1 ABC transporter ATP-binding protein [Bacteroidota bacterium]MBT4411881.1 ABC transporter ATP-binding protein [Bacteroidota bacterium]MBT5426367.1 ABC transporter ATP-binding protein [Bacteroidota bacterium]MBT7092031.1 ABC transporter ATP-binding protein [Bacteroidota bacterium]